MIIKYNVQCGPVKPKELEIDKDTVYERSNFHQITSPEGEEGWEYDERQLTLLEYFHTSVPETEESLAELSNLFGAYMAQVDAAIAELSIAIGGKD